MHAKLRFGPESLLLLAFCTLDTVSSALLFHLGLAVEANPIVRPFAEAGVLPFISFKSATFIPALAVAEWCRARHPGFVQLLLNRACCLYAGIYLLGLLVQFQS